MVIESPSDSFRILLQIFFWVLEASERVSEAFFWVLRVSGWASANFCRMVSGFQQPWVRNSWIVSDIFGSFGGVLQGYWGGLIGV